MNQPKVTIALLCSLLIVHYSFYSVYAAPAFQSNGSCEDLNNMGLLLYSQSRFTEALAQFETALTCARKMDDQDLENTLLYNIGSLYLQQEHYQEALAYFQQALVMARKIGDRAGEGRILANIGSLYTHQGRYAEALEYFQQSLTIVREENNETEQVGTILNNIGQVYRLQRRYEEALAYFQQALDNNRKVDNRIGEGRTLASIGLVYTHQGRYAEAMEYFQRGLVIAREESSPSDEATILDNIGLLYQNQGRYEEALDHSHQALAIFQNIEYLGDASTTLNNIGLIYEAQGRYEEAIEVYQQSLVHVSKVGDRASEGIILGNIGSVYTQQGRYAQALEYFQQALAITHEVGDPAFESNILNELGTLNANYGYYPEAMQLFQQALAISQELGRQMDVGNTLSNIALVYQAQGRFAEAQESYEQAIKISEDLRAIAGSEEARSSFIAQFSSVYDSYMLLLHQQGQAEAAFLLSERGRARAFLDSLATGQVQLSDNEAAELLAQEQELYAQRRALQDNLAQSRALNPPDSALIADLESQLAEVEGAYGDIQAQIQARGNQLADLIPGRSQNVLGVAEVQNLLDEQTALLSFYTLEEQTLAFILTPDHFDVIELPAPREQLANQVNHFRDLIGFRQPAETRQAAQELYEVLIKPVAHSQTFEVLETSKVSRLLIVPHGPLHYLPFAALRDPDSGQYLLQRYQVVVIPSASALPFIQANAGGKLTNPLILGNPAPPDAGLASLKFAEKEARTIADLLDAKPLLGQSATESNLWQQVSQAGILHVAAHGQYNAANPLYSTLALTPDDQNDGWLEVREVYGLDLTQTELVVLSACQTQLGELSAGDEVVGLSRAFFFAGTPTVIATLWSVDDAATNLLMEEFYRNLNQGMSKAEALRQAQVALIENESYAHPYYWSAFVLSGDGGAVEPISRAGQEGLGEVVAQGTETGQSKIANLNPKVGWVLFGSGGLVCLLASAVFIGGGVWWLLRRQR